MKRLERLKREAKESATLRGHTLSKFRSPKILFGYSSLYDTASAECRICKAWVDVDGSPAPNGIDIGGPAVALNCPTDSKKGEQPQ